MQMVPRMERVLYLPRLMLKPEIPLGVEARPSLNPIAVLKRLQAPDLFFSFASHNNILRQKQMERLLPQRDGAGKVSPSAETDPRFPFGLRFLNNNQRNGRIRQGGIEQARNLLTKCFEDMCRVRTSEAGQCCALAKHMCQHGQVIPNVVISGLPLPNSFQDFFAGQPEPLPRNAVYHLAQFVLVYDANFPANPGPPSVSLHGLPIS